MDNMLHLSFSPHIHCGKSTASIMRDVLIALAPAAIAGTVIFGLRALLVIAVCVGSAVLFEALFNILTKKEQTIGDLSAAVTGLLLALNVPANTPVWQCIVGTLFAIVMVKCLFGGIGHNLVNPAITARVFMLVAFSNLAKAAFPTIVLASAFMTMRHLVLSSSVMRRLGRLSLLQKITGSYALCDESFAVFSLSEDKSFFSSKDRMEMVKLGTADIPNVTVLPTGPYLISSATFPTYFLKEQGAKEQIHCLLDIEIFCNHYVPKFGISRRYVGTEPFCNTTGQYNEALIRHLPEKGIALRQIQRLEEAGTPISASAVRQHLQAGEFEVLKQLLPSTTYNYLESHGFMK